MNDDNISFENFGQPHS